MRFVTLEEIALNEKNAIVDGPFGSSLKTSDYVKEGIPVLQGKNITGDKFVFTDIRFISHEKAKQLARSKVKVGDFLMVKIGSIGYLAQIDDLQGYDYAIIPANLAKIRIDNKKVTPEYFKQIFKQRSTKNELLKLASKTAQPALSLSKIKSFKVPLPSLLDQIHIAKVLNKSEALISQRKESIRMLDELLKSTFLEMFGDPVKNAKGFHIIKVEEISTAIKDGPHVSPKYVDSGVPILSTRNVRPGKLILEEMKYVSEETYKELTKRFKPIEGDVLITKGGTTGYAKVVDFNFKFCIWVHLAIVRLKPFVHPLYFEHAFNSDYCYFQSQKFTHGITNKDLGLTRIAKIEMLLPPYELQVQFAQIVKKVEDQKVLYRQSLLELESLYGALSQKAFKGELKDNSVKKIAVELTATLK